MPGGGGGGGGLSYHTMIIRGIASRKQVRVGGMAPPWPHCSNASDDYIASSSNVKKSIQYLMLMLNE